MVNGPQNWFDRRWPTYTKGPYRQSPNPMENRPGYLVDRRYGMGAVPVSPVVESATRLDQPASALRTSNISSANLFPNPPSQLPPRSTQVLFPPKPDYELDSFKKDWSPRPAEIAWGADAENTYPLTGRHGHKHPALSPVNEPRTAPPKRALKDTTTRLESRRTLRDDAPNTIASPTEWSGGRLVPADKTQPSLALRQKETKEEMRPYMDLDDPFSPVFNALEIPGSSVRGLIKAYNNYNTKAYEHGGEDLLLPDIPGQIRNGPNDPSFVDAQQIARPGAGLAELTAIRALTDPLFLDSIPAIGKAAYGAVKAAPGAVKSAYGAARAAPGAVTDAYNTAAPFFRAATGAVGDAYKAAAPYVKAAPGAVNDAANAIMFAPDRIADAVGGAYKSAAGSVADAARGAYDQPFMRSAAGAVGDAYKSAAGAAGDAYKSTAGAVGDAAKRTADTARGLFSTKKATINPLGIDPATYARRTNPSITPDPRYSDGEDWWQRNSQRLGNYKVGPEAIDLPQSVASAAADQRFASMSEPDLLMMWNLADKAGDKGLVKSINDFRFRHTYSRMEKKWTPDTPRPKVQSAAEIADASGRFAQRGLPVDLPAGKDLPPAMQEPVGLTDEITPLAGQKRLFDPNEVAPQVKATPQSELPVDLPAKRDSLINLGAGKPQFSTQKPNLIVRNQPNQMRFNQPAPQAEVAAAKAESPQVKATPQSELPVDLPAKRDSLINLGAGKPNLIVRNQPKQMRFNQPAPQAQVKATPQSELPVDLPAPQAAVVPAKRDSLINLLAGKPQFSTQKPNLIVRNQPNQMRFNQPAPQAQVAPPKVEVPAAETPQVQTPAGQQRSLLNQFEVVPPAKQGELPVDLPAGMKPLAGQKSLFNNRRPSSLDPPRIKFSQFQNSNNKPYDSYNEVRARDATTSPAFRGNKSSDSLGNADIPDIPQPFIVRAPQARVAPAKRKVQPARRASLQYPELPNTTGMTPSQLKEGYINAVERGIETPEGRNLEAEAYKNAYLATPEGQKARAERILDKTIKERAETIDRERFAERYSGLGTVTSPEMKQLPSGDIVDSGGREIPKQAAPAVATDPVATEAYGPLRPLTPEKRESLREKGKEYLASFPPRTQSQGRQFNQSEVWTGTQQQQDAVIKQLDSSRVPAREQIPGTAPFQTGRRQEDRTIAEVLGLPFSPRGQLPPKRRELPAPPDVDALNRLIKSAERETKPEDLLRYMEQRRDQSGQRGSKSELGGVAPRITVGEDGFNQYVAELTGTNDYIPMNNAMVSAIDELKARKGKDAVPANVMQTLQNMRREVGRTGSEKRLGEFNSVASDYGVRVITNKVDAAVRELPPTIEIQRSLYGTKVNYSAMSIEQLSTNFTNFVRSKKDFDKAKDLFRAANREQREALYGLVPQGKRHKVFEAELRAIHKELNGAATPSTAQKAAREIAGRTPAAKALPTVKVEAATPSTAQKAAREIAGRPSSSTMEELHSKLDDMSINDTKKSAVIKEATKAYKDGLIDENALNEINRISKDNDMGTEDVIESLKQSLDLGTHDREQIAEADAQTYKWIREKIVAGDKYPAAPYSSERGRPPRLGEVGRNPDRIAGSKLSEDQLSAWADVDYFLRKEIGLLNAGELESIANKFEIDRGLSDLGGFRKKIMARLHPDDILDEIESIFKPSTATPRTAPLRRAEIPAADPKPTTSTASTAQQAAQEIAKPQRTPAVEAADRLVSYMFDEIPSSEVAEFRSMFNRLDSESKKEVVKELSRRGLISPNAARKPLMFAGEVHNHVRKNFNKHKEAYEQKLNSDRTLSRIDSPFSDEESYKRMVNPTTPRTAPPKRGK